MKDRIRQALRRFLDLPESDRSQYRFNLLNSITKKLEEKLEAQIIALRGDLLEVTQMVAGQDSEQTRELVSKLCSIARAHDERLEALTKTLVDAVVEQRVSTERLAPMWAEFMKFRGQPDMGPDFTPEELEKLEKARTAREADSAFVREQIETAKTEGQ